MTDTNDKFTKEQLIRIVDQQATTIENWQEMHAKTSYRLSCAEEYIQTLLDEILKD